MVRFSTIGCLEVPEGHNSSKIDRAPQSSQIFSKLNKVGTTPIKMGQI